MQRDKSLVATVKETIKQHEKLANRLQFIFPVTYELKDISTCKIVMKYHNELNQASVEFLVKDEELYKGEYIRCFLPIDSGFTNAAGNITLQITFLEIDYDNNVTYVLNTSEFTIYVEPVNDYYQYINSFDGSLSKIDQIIGNKLDWYNSENSMIKREDYCDVVLFDGTKARISPTIPDPPIREFTGNCTTILFDKNGNRDYTGTTTSDSGSQCVFPSCVEPFCDHMIPEIIQAGGIAP